MECTKKVLKELKLPEDYLSRSQKERLNNPTLNREEEKEDNE